MMNWLRFLRHFLGPLVQGRELIRLGLSATSPQQASPPEREHSCGSRIVPYRPYRLNAPGPFYSVNAGCVVCLAPQAAAPALMQCYDDPSGTGAQSHCFFARQPETPNEFDQAIKAMAVSCVENLRYRGNDPKILKRLCEMGYGHLCDTIEVDHCRGSVMGYPEIPGPLTATDQV